jgi:hypothetical protein
MLHGATSVLCAAPYSGRETSAEGIWALPSGNLTIYYWLPDDDRIILLSIVRRNGEN